MWSLTAFVIVCVILPRNAGVLRTVKFYCPFSIWSYWTTLLADEALNKTIMFHRHSSTQVNVISIYLNPTQRRSPSWICSTVLKDRAQSYVGPPKNKKKYCQSGMYGVMVLQSMSNFSLSSFWARKHLFTPHLGRFSGCNQPLKVDAWCLVFVRGSMLL